LGYAVQEENGKYSLTHKITALGNKIYSKNSVIKFIHPHLKKVADLTGCTAHLVERNGDEIRYIDKVTPQNGIFAVGSFIGMEISMYSSAVGKAILCYLGDEEIDKIWNSKELVVYTKNTITSLEQLKKELAEGRKTGITYDREEREAGIFCVATSLVDFTNETKYAISVSAPAGILVPEKRKEIEELLLEARKNIEPLLGKLPTDKNKL
ncbi:MAG: IclR family transcriptional regulator, partial [Anaerotignaceae bacterium]